MSEVKMLTPVISLEIDREPIQAYIINQLDTREAELLHGLYRWFPNRGNEHMVNARPRPDEPGSRHITHSLRDHLDNGDIIEDHFNYNHAPAQSPHVTLWGEKKPASLDLLAQDLMLGIPLGNLGSIIAAAPPEDIKDTPLGQYPALKDHILNPTKKSFDKLAQAQPWLLQFLIKSGYQYTSGEDLPDILQADEWLHRLRQGDPLKFYEIAVEAFPDFTLIPSNLRKEIAEYIPPESSRTTRLSMYKMGLMAFAAAGVALGGVVAGQTDNETLRIIMNDSPALAIALGTGGGGIVVALLKIESDTEKKVDRLMKLHLRNRYPNSPGNL